MPMFIDYHDKLPAMSEAQLQQLRANLGKPDALGTKDLELIFTKDGHGYCISEAKDADAVCKSHEALGVKLSPGDVHEIQAEFRQ
jgi:hypothetical protein